MICVSFVVGVGCLIGAVALSILVIVAVTIGHGRTYWAIRGPPSSSIVAVAVVVSTHVDVVVAVAVSVVVVRRESEKREDPEPRGVGNH